MASTVKAMTSPERASTSKNWNTMPGDGVHGLGRFDSAARHLAQLLLVSASRDEAGSSHNSTAGRRFTDIMR